MTVAFPAIEPTGRSFKAPSFQTSTLTSQSGVVTRRLWASKPSAASLSLEFNNISDDSVTQILSAHYEAKGSVEELELPQIIFNGASSALKAWLDTSATNAGLIWCFEEGSTPQVESIAPNRSKVSVKLSAELRMR